MAREAVAAFAAGNVMGHEHAVAHPHAVHAGPDLDNLCGNLVSQDERRLRLPVPLQDVGAADARVGDADEDRVRVGLETRDGAIFEADVVGRLEDKGEVLERGWMLDVGRMGELLGF